MLERDPVTLHSGLKISDRSNQSLDAGTIGVVSRSSTHYISRFVADFPRALTFVYEELVSEFSPANLGFVRLRWMRIEPADDPRPNRLTLHGGRLTAFSPAGVRSEEEKRCFPNTFSQFLRGEWSGGHD